jgi:hypothetical protein
VVPHASEPLDAFEHLRVVVGGQCRLRGATLRHRQEPDEVGQPRKRRPLQLGVLVPELVDVPRLVGDHEVVGAVLHRLLKDHEVGDQDLVHVAERLEDVQVMLAAVRHEVGRLAGQPTAGRVQGLTGVGQHAGDRWLREPVDVQSVDPFARSAGDREVAPHVTQADRP